ncbi:hypothetical protein AVEN_108210-1 [Araneus ventricosus]|uniref:Uncharacterized protein n=1 Tax=Araneus ventricosus TaxID=182803 RepID=A0A4Y2I4B1_ARAVE|nr:hypothetical protein AVEN_108210-1 [Araneus ventricosus]
MTSEPSPPLKTPRDHQSCLIPSRVGCSGDGTAFRHCFKPTIHFTDKLDILESEKEKAIKIYGNQPNGLWWLEFRLD